MERLLAFGILILASLAVYVILTGNMTLVQIFMAIFG